MWTRRGLLRAGGLALFSVGVGVGPDFLGRTALAAPGRRPFRRRKTLVTIFQRGAMDGLMAVTPLDERRLSRLRPRLAMSAASSAGPERLLDLDAGFGLHPAFSDLMPFWKDRDLAIVHAVGSPDPTRSHFDAQDYMETGTPGRRGTASGWLNRASGLLGHDGSAFRNVAMTSSMPRSFHGPEGAIALESLDDLRLRVGSRVATRSLGQSFETLSLGARDQLFRDASRSSFEAVDAVNRVTATSYRPAAGAVYPSSPLGDSLRQIAQLIKADLGLEIAFAESGGWDTHVQQGTAGGSFARRSRDLGGAIAAFWRDLESFRDDVAVMTMTEFGRTVRENGSGGTDHGHGSCLFVLGADVRGGKVHGELPGLGDNFLFEGRDLPVTTDFRAVFSEVAGKHLGIDNDGRMFPGWEGGRLPLLET